MKRNKVSRDKRQTEANKRQHYWDSLDVTSKIESLDYKLGQGKGAKKQREKLSYLLSKSIL
jgi:hypothetical protein